MSRRRAAGLIQRERRGDGSKGRLVRAHRRASGSFRIRAPGPRARRSSPACGPPTSLSPLNVTMSEPAASRSDGSGSWARPKRAVSSNAPLPRSSTTIAPWRVGKVGDLVRDRAPRRSRPARSSTGARAGRFGPDRPAAAPRSRRLASGSSFRPRSVVHRRRRTISGMRTPPPISTSSPRLTATPPSSGQARPPARPQPRCCS
jgi:hypothetical protein